MTAAATAAKDFINMQISCASHRTWTRQELALLCGERRRVCCKRRRRIVRELLMLLVGALDGDVVEENRRNDGGLGNGRDRLRDPGLATGGDDVGTERALIEIVECGAAEERALAVRRNAVEHTRHQLATTEGLDLIDVFVPLLSESEEFGAQLFHGEVLG